MGESGPLRVPPAIPAGQTFRAHARTPGGRSLAEAFDRARSEGRTALVGYWMGGYPDLPTSGQALDALADGGCDVIEVGVPFTDPVADGPTLQDAGHRALLAGATLFGVVEVAGAVARARRVPVVIMSYLNPLLSSRLERLARRMSARGLAGAIVPDVPVEESAELSRMLASEGLAWIGLAAPTSAGRLRQIASASDGFVYAVSRAGVTGARDELAPEARVLVDGLHEVTGLPVALGFGVAGPEQARAYRFADGVVVGSAFTKAWKSAGPGGAEAVAAVAKLARGIREALRAS